MQTSRLPLQQTSNDTAVVISHLPLGDVDGLWAWGWTEWGEVSEENFKWRQARLSMVQLEQRGEGLYLYLHSRHLRRPFFWGGTTEYSIFYESS